MSESATSKQFFGHPWGLSTLFFTEMWERLSYYGMRALLILYMTSELAKGGLGWDTKSAAVIYGLYTSSAYFLPLIGGWLADRFIGAKKATLIGGIIITIGHFLLAFPPVTFFYAGLIFVAIGTGFLKGNISKMVGDLYAQGDDRRDAGFSIYYMGINLGALLAPFVCGTLAVYNWHWGFAAAGVGMILGLIQYVIGWKYLKGVGDVPTVTETGLTEKTSSFYVIQIIVLIAATIGAALFFGKTWLMPILLVSGLIAVLLTGMQDKLTLNDWKRLFAILILFTFATVFWMGFEQAGSSLNLFGEQMTDRSFLGGYEIPTAWFQSINPFFIVLLAPLFAWFWVKLQKNQPSDAVKFSLGLTFAGLGFVAVAYASTVAGDKGASVWWLILVYFLHTIGELFLSPVGLSSMTKLAPIKMISLMMGVWFLSVSLGSFIGGMIAGEFVKDGNVLFSLFMKVALVMIGSAFLLSLIAPFFEKMAKSRD